MDVLLFLDISKARIRDNNESERSRLVQFAQQDVVHVRWTASKGACPKCLLLHGRKIRVAKRVNKPYPLTGLSHPGCRCTFTQVT